MEKLPTDIMLDIASRLPYETMFNCKLVCKPWRDILSFIKVVVLFQFGNAYSKLCYGGEQYDDIDMDVNYSYRDLVEIKSHRSTELDEPPLRNMVGSCNGLACFSVQGKSPLAYDPIYICNPNTKEYVYLPEYNYDKAYTYKGMTSGNFICGFGYHRSKNEYKVVRIYNDHNNEREGGQVQVYTLGSGHGWRDTGRIDHRLSSEPGVCANGALHWVDRRKNGIVAFDLADEEFRLIPSPPLSPIWRVSQIVIKLLGGCLCVVHIDVGEKDQFYHIWALEKKNKPSSYDMKKEHEFNDCWRWSQKFSIPCTKNEMYKPFAVTKSNQVLMSSSDGVFCYDSKTNVLRKLWNDSPRGLSQAFPHVHSLVSLEVLGEKSKRRR